jgi:hypothetical protein
MELQEQLDQRVRLAQRDQQALLESMELTVQQDRRVYKAFKEYKVSRVSLDRKETRV